MKNCTLSANTKTGWICINERLCMLTLLNNSQIDDYLHEIGPFAPDRYWEVGLSVLLRYYRFHSAWQYVYDGTSTDFIDILKGEIIPPLPNDCKVTVVYEMTGPCFFAEVNEVERLAKRWFMGDSLMQFTPINNPSENSFKLRITLIYHAAERRRQHIDNIVPEYDMLKRTNIKIAKVLDKEMAQNEKAGALARLETEVLRDFVDGHHLLWAEIANSTNSIEEVYENLSPGMSREVARYDISGLILFFEVDKQFTTMGEVEQLKARLAELTGKDVKVAVNIRLTNSYIKFITCRAVLVGNPKYIKGEVYEDFDRYEILLYEDSDKERGHLIVASYDTDKEFCLSRYDWGYYDYSRDGRTDDHHYFNVENTEKLFAALKVKTPDALLRTIRRRFASRFPSMADSELLEYCRQEGIAFHSDYHY